MESSAETSRCLKYASLLASSEAPILALTCAIAKQGATKLCLPTKESPQACLLIRLESRLLTQNVLPTG